jgi:hypothetical protein
VREKEREKDVKRKLFICGNFFGRKKVSDCVFCCYLPHSTSDIAKGESEKKSELFLFFFINNAINGILKKQNVGELIFEYMCVGIHFVCIMSADMYVRHPANLSGVYVKNDFVVVCTFLYTKHFSPKRFYIIVSHYHNNTAK